MKRTTCQRQFYNQKKIKHMALSTTISKIQPVFAVIIILITYVASSEVLIPTHSIAAGTFSSETRISMQSLTDDRICVDIQLRIIFGILAKEISRCLEPNIPESLFLGPQPGVFPFKEILFKFDEGEITAEVANPDTIILHTIIAPVLSINDSPKFKCNFLKKYDKNQNGQIDNIEFFEVLDDWINSIIDRTDLALAIDSWVGKDKYCIGQLL